jgi:hypothetical protein
MTPVQSSPTEPEPVLGDANSPSVGNTRRTSLLNDLIRFAQRTPYYESLNRFAQRIVDTPALLTFIGLSPVWILCMIMFVFHLITIELTIPWNNITGVNDLLSTGQLIPFVIGAGSVVQTFLVIVKKGLHMRKERKARKEQ